MLWEERAEAGLETGAHWCPFRFDIPAGLPAAIEGRTIAWRYSIEACSEPGRGMFADRAIVTPLRFDVCQSPI